MCLKNVVLCVINVIMSIIVREAKRKMKIEKDKKILKGYKNNDCIICMKLLED